MDMLLLYLRLVRGCRSEAPTVVSSRAARATSDAEAVPATKSVDADSTVGLELERWKVKERLSDASGLDSGDGALPSRPGEGVGEGDGTRDDLPVGEPCVSDEDRDRPNGAAAPAAAPADAAAAVAVAAAVEVGAGCAGLGDRTTGDASFADDPSVSVVLAGGAGDAVLPE